MKTYNFILVPSIFLLLLLSIYNFPGCSNSITNSGVVTIDSSSKGYVEKEFYFNSGLRAGEGVVIVDNLEDLNSPSVTEDTGPVGEDVIPFQFNETAVRKFRVGDSSALRMKLIDDVLGLTIVDLMPGQRTSITLLAGNYKMHLISLQQYSAADSTSTNMVFLHPDQYVDGNPKYNFVAERGICVNCRFYYLDMNHVNLKNSFLDSSSFRNINLIGANFSEGSLSHCYFGENFMQEGWYFKTHFHYAYITNCVLDNAQFQKSVGYGSTFNSIKSARRSDFSNADLNYVTFEDCNISNFTGGGVQMGGANFKKTTFDSLKFQWANLKNAIFQNSKILHSDFSGGSFENGQIIDNLTLITVNIRDANMCGLDKHKITYQDLDIDQYTECWP